VRNDLEMFGLAANDTTDRDNTVVFSLIEFDRSGDRNFQRAGHNDLLDRNPSKFQALHRARFQFGNDISIELRSDDEKTRAR
jgi:hypothetical protein